MITVILSLVLISLTAYRDNALREEAMAEAYLNKIWIASDWTGEAYRDIYFYFNKIADKKCEGGFKMGIYRIGGGDYLRSTVNRFTGIIDGKTAECRFIDYGGRTGSMEFTFVNDNEIEAAISYDGEDTTERKTFRPYNIKDIDYLTLQEEPAVQVDLDYWGSVYFVAGIKSEEGNTWPRPRAYLVNENYDILYEFNTAFQVGLKIYDVDFKDVNGDGLEDVVISTYFANNGIEAEGMPHLYWLFLQSDTGMFELETAWTDQEEPESGG